jgi:hypothetical protein
MVHSFSKGKQTRCQDPTKKKKKTNHGIAVFFSSDYRIYATIKTTNPNKKKKHKAGNRKIFKENITLNKRIQ